MQPPRGKKNMQGRRGVKFQSSSGVRSRTPLGSESEEIFRSVFENDFDRVSPLRPSSRMRPARELDGKWQNMDFSSRSGARGRTACSSGEHSGKSGQYNDGVFNVDTDDAVVTRNEVTTRVGDKVTTVYHVTVQSKIDGSIIYQYNEVEKEAAEESEDCACLLL